MTVQTKSSLSNHWTSPDVVEGYATGVSLHSHTSASEETLKFIHMMGEELPGMKRVVEYFENRVKARYGITLDFLAAHWRPPLQPRMAYRLEAKQIWQLGLEALVSITDHDTLEGALLLRTLPSSRHIPMSVEWTAPFGGTVFHMGIHNLPSAVAAEWMKRFEQFTAQPSDAGLLAMLRELHDMPQVLTVLNHPLWDLYKSGELHVAELKRFIVEAGKTVHALELNGLRHARENKEVARLARETGHLIISGGDRHGLEPNANINLSNATNFTEFVEEIRVERVSHVHFMPQYGERWEQRLMQSTVEAISNHGNFMPGWQRWDERAFHPDANGVMRPFSELWPNGKPPVFLRTALAVTRLLGRKTWSTPISIAVSSRNKVNGVVPDNNWVSAEA